MPPSKAKMKTLPDVPWQRKGCRHSKEFRRDRQSYTDIRKESQIKCLRLGAGVFVLPVTSLCVWGSGPWPIPFFFSGCSFFTAAFCTTRDYLCSFTWTLLTPATRGGKCLTRRNFSITENLDLIWTTWHTLKKKKRKNSGCKAWNRQAFVFVCVHVCAHRGTARQQLLVHKAWAVLSACRCCLPAEPCWKHSAPSGSLHGLMDACSSRQFYLQLNWKHINFRLLTHL